MPGKTQKAGFSRVFIIEDRAGPAHQPIYYGMSRAMSPDWPQGDVTPIRAPSTEVYGQFVIIDEVKGMAGLPSLPVQSWYEQDLSDFLRIVRKGCRLDLQVHMGECRDPRNFNDFDKILVLEAARPTNWGTTELGALGGEEEAAIREDVPMTGLDLYEIKRLAIAEFGETEVEDEIVAVTLCDARQCGECGLPSDGCQKIFAMSAYRQESPGYAPELLYSSDQGVTLGQTIVTTLPSNLNASDMTCVGIYLVIVSNGDCGIHYAPIADVLAGTEVWTRTAAGLTCPAGTPNAIFSLGSVYTWIVGAGGYAYFSSDITSGVVLQPTAIAASGGSDLFAVHGYDEFNIVAVGAANTVIVTRNGGITWAATLTSPAGIADVLCSVWMKSKEEWFVGDCTNGRLFYTRDGGATWTEKAFPGSGTGTLPDIFFSTPTVGYLSHTIPATLVNPAIGRILRTIDGGYSWYVLPEGATAFPANQQINSIIGCGEDVNLIIGGGVGAGGDIGPGGGQDGILIKGA